MTTLAGTVALTGALIAYAAGLILLVVAAVSGLLRLARGWRHARTQPPVSSESTARATRVVRDLAAQAKMTEPTVEVCRRWALRQPPVN